MVICFVVIFIFIIILIPASGNSDAVVPETEKLFMEGQVIQKFECQPVG